jgi:hypothetical protein
MADFSPADGAMISGIIIGAGYLLVFPFWMIRKLTRIECRLKYLQSDIKQQDEVLEGFDHRIEELDASLEERRKEIMQIFQIEENKTPEISKENKPVDNL